MSKWKIIILFSGTIKCVAKYGSSISTRDLSYPVTPLAKIKVTPMTLAAVKDEPITILCAAWVPVFLKSAVPEFLWYRNGTLITDKGTHRKCSKNKKKYFNNFIGISYYSF